MKKSFDLSTKDATISNLKELLSKCKGNSSFKLQLVVDEDFSEEESQYSRLESLCYSLYCLLCDAQRCVEIVARKEKATGSNLIYYEDKVTCSNNGAQALYKDIRKAIESYPRDMLQIDLERDL